MKVNEKPNKFKTCQDCQDRSIDPNCHATCEGYLHRRKIYDNMRDEKKVERERANMIDEYIIKKVWKR